MPEFQKLLGKKTQKIEVIEMEKSKLGGDKNGLGLYELMTAPKGIYLKALAAIEKNDFDKFYEVLGVNKPKAKSKGGE